MVLRIIASGSSGNAYVLDGGREALLLEAGADFSRVKRALDWDVTKVAGCLLTHEHQDHARKVNDVLEAAIPVYASKGTLAGAGLRTKNMAWTVAVESGVPFRVGGFSVIPFRTKHDSADPLGFYIFHPECGRVLFATDTYYLPFTFDGLNNILIECNYRLDILDGNIASGATPAAVRNRVIRSHFSYDHCLQALLANDLSAVNNIVLIHLSGGNSDAEEFREGIRAATGKTVCVAEAGMVIDFNKTPF